MPSNPESRDRAGNRYVPDSLRHPHAAPRSGPNTTSATLRPLPSRARFVRHLLRNGALAGAFVACSLTIGAIGYHSLGGLQWLDAYLNASMILTGMGPVNDLTTPAAKLFAIAYTLYSGVAFLTITAVLLGPVAVRILHRFHLELDKGEVEESDAPGHDDDAANTRPDRS
ncbi:MAG: hypothetical protein IT360_08115 [Gemmatimonadaceae bacterium]|nr:hypothetical protein [Gemmatimonadaceae bacterium]